MKKKKGFTLVELLAVIMILAIIVVIAVPEIMNIVDKSTEEAFATSVKLIASSAEEKRMSNKLLGINKDIMCEDIAKLSREDYASCSIRFVDGKAKVKIVGKGKFEGMAVCGGTKENAEVKMKNSCPAAPVSFTTDSWETIKAAVDEGDTGKYNVGDTKTINLGTKLGTHTVRIANNSHYGAECKDTNGNALASETACGFVIEFADIITTRKMNSANTNAGGWPGSQMYDYINVTEETGSGTIYNALVAAIGDIIIDTKVVSSHGSGDTSGTLENNNFESIDKVYLLSTREVWGKEGTSNIIAYDSADGDKITRQLDYYKNNNVTTSNFSGAIKKGSSGSASYWWFRSALSYNTDSFYAVSNGGDWSNSSASNTYGVSPAFRLG